MWTTAANLYSSSWFDSNFFLKNAQKYVMCRFARSSQSDFLSWRTLQKVHTKRNWIITNFAWLVQNSKSQTFCLLLPTDFLLCVHTTFFRFLLTKNCGLKSGQDHLYVWIFVLKQMKKPNLYLRFHYFALFLLSNQRTSFNEDENHKSLFKNVTKPCVTF